MPGLFRFSLALLVIVSHFADANRYAALGFYAVRAFFVLSGFAITASLNETYHFDLRKFWTNRFLRLVPQYQFTCFLMLAIIYFYPVETANFQQRWQEPHSFLEIMQNLLILPLAINPPTFRLIMPAWSIAVELLMYILLFFVVSRNAINAVLALCAGLLYQIWMIEAGAPFEVRYFTMSAALSPFALGAVAYFAQKSIAAAVRPALAAALVVAWFANLFADQLFASPHYVQYTGYYVNTLLAAGVVALLPAIQNGPRLRRIDALFGALAYPMFIVQFLAAFAVHQFIAPELGYGWLYVASVVAVGLAFALPMAIVQGRFVDPLRDQIRARPATAAHTINAETPELAPGASVSVAG